MPDNTCATATGAAICRWARGTAALWVAGHARTGPTRAAPWRRLVAHPAEDHVPTVEVRCCRRRNVPLRPVRIAPCVRHAQQPWFVMFRLEALVGKVGPINGLATRPIGADKVATLDHQTGDDAVDRRALVVHWHPGQRVEPSLPRDQRTEVLGRLWQPVSPQLDLDALSSDLRLGCALRARADASMAELATRAPGRGPPIGDRDVQPDARIGLVHLAHSLRQSIAFLRVESRRLLKDLRPSGGHVRRSPGLIGAHWGSRVRAAGRGSRGACASG